MGTPKIFEEIIEETVKRSNSCSRDPLCAEDDPVDKNGAMDDFDNITSAAS